MSNLKILLVTSKWSAEDYDGGMSTAIDICDTISPYCHLDVLTPSAFMNQKREGVNNIIGYDIPEQLIKNHNGSRKFETRMSISKILTPILLPLIKLYDRIIIVHIFHILDLCDYITNELGKKIILFPMMLTPSYQACTELVPKLYTNKEKMALLTVGRIITPSHYEKSQITHFYNIPESNVIMVPRYISDSFIRNIHSITSSKGCEICYVASIKKQKQNILALRLLNDLCTNGIDAKLNIVGPIHDIDIYNDLIDYISKNQLGNRINHFYAISKEEINSLYRKATFGISVSLCETFGRSVIEGLATGLPTLVMNTVACLENDVPTQTGVIRVNSIPKMVEKVDYYLNNHAAYRLLSLSAIEYGSLYRRDQIQPILAKELLH